MGTKLKCKKCGDIIEGDRLGHLISCSCESCTIDETPYYYRVLGNSKDILIYNDKSNKFEDLSKSIEGDV